MIYFIRAASGAVKIGFSIKPSSRVSNLQCGNAEPLQIIRAIPGDRRAERWLHREFRGSKIHGEWFSYSDRMLSIELPNEPMISLDEMKNMRNQGMTFTQIAQVVGVSRQRIHQLLRDRGCRATERMLRPQTEIGDFINALGGPRKVARRLGWPVSTVHYYSSSNKLPHWRRKPLETLAKRKKITLPEVS